MAEPAESPEGASPRRSRVLARRTVVAVAVIVIMSVPFAVFAVISGQVPASSWAVLAGAAALSNLADGGRAIGYLTVGLLTALIPVAIVSGAVPVAGAALMAIMCFGVGLSAARGLNRGTLLIPMYLAFFIIAPPPWSGHMVDRTTTSYLLWNMLFWGGGGLWAMLVFPPLLRKMKMKMPPRPKPWARADTLVYTITITVLCTASTLGVLIWWPGSNGAWLVVTVLAVTQLGGDATVKRTLQRVPGTIVGVVIAAIVASVSGSEAVLLGLGLVLGVILVVIALGPHSYFLWSVFVTPTVVLFTATSIADVHKTDAQRLVFTLIGCALILLASGIALGWAHYQQAHPSAAVES
jgi:hypothetical protein